MPKGLASVFKGGLSEKRIAERAGGSRDPFLIRFKDGEPVPLQFCGNPTDSDAFKEFEQHGWQSGRTWTFVPCIGDGCVVCEDEDDQISKTSYAFAAQVWSFKDKKMMVLSGGTLLAQRLVFKFKRGKDNFTRRAWDLTRLATQPKSYDIEVSETARGIRLSDKDPVDLAKYLKDRYDAYAKSHGGSKPSTLDEDEYEEDEYDDDDEEEMDEEEVPTRSQMQKMEWADLKDYAKSVGVTLRTNKRSELIDAIEEAQEEE